MKQVTVHNGQNLLDICIQEYGSVSALMQLIKDNAISLDHTPTVGEVLLIDDSISFEPDITNYFQQREVNINTWSMPLPEQTFISTWNTAYEGISESNQIALPLEATGTYDFTVRYEEVILKTITDYTDNLITFPDGSGIKTIEINGLIKGWRFNNTGDALKITNISNWGSLNLGNNQSYFKGCANLDLSGAGSDLDLVGTTDLTSAWDGCTAITSFPKIDTSTVTVFTGAWYTCSSLTSFPAIDTSSGTHFIATWGTCSSLTSFPLIDTSSGVDFTSAWIYCSSLTSFPKINTRLGNNFSATWSNCTSLATFPLLNTSSGTNFLASWQNCTGLTSFPLINMRNMTLGISCFFGTDIGIQYYTNLLVDLNTHNNNSNVQFHGGNATYDTTGAEARTSLISDHSWTIIDGGRQG